MKQWDLFKMESEKQILLLQGKFFFLKNFLE